jgi:hypothetical protein
VPKSRMHAATHPLLPSWHGAQLKKAERQFYLKKLYFGVNKRCFFLKKVMI